MSSSSGLLLPTPPPLSRTTPQLLPGKISNSDYSGFRNSHEAGVAPWHQLTRIPLMATILGSWDDVFKVWEYLDGHQDKVRQYAIDVGPSIIKMGVILFLPTYVSLCTVSREYESAQVVWRVSATSRDSKYLGITLCHAQAISQGSTNSLSTAGSITFYHSQRPDRSTAPAPVSPFSPTLDCLYYLIIQYPILTTTTSPPPPPPPVVLSNFCSRMPVISHDDRFSFSGR